MKPLILIAISLICATACNWWTAQVQDSSGRSWTVAGWSGGPERARCRVSAVDPSTFDLCWVQQSLLVNGCVTHPNGSPIWCSRNPAPWPVQVLSY